MSSSRQFGTIKLWNEDPGNGRIIPQDGGPDLTVVLADIESEQHPLAGSAVKFTKDGQHRAVEVEVVAEVNIKEPRISGYTSSSSSMLTPTGKIFISTVLTPEVMNN
ncbi:hypothetical protein N7G274_000527 [Stereocaulon virgatum]|uniref:CSD domain-containing protein n=1 Tax=Stereocaulon virgatum TaxID=373712 RepID=A0ABR4ATM9_9LECA